MGQTVSAEDVKKEAVKFFTKTFGARFKEEWLKERSDTLTMDEGHGKSWHEITEWFELSLGPDTITSSKYPTANEMAIFVPNKWGRTGSIHMNHNWTVLNRDEDMAAPTLKAMTKLLEEYFKPDASQSSPPPAVGAHAVLLRMCDLLEA